jgi:excisionase family DNA binding protein
MTQQSEWISVRQMQQLLSIGATKTRELLAWEDIEAVQIGRAIRVNRASLERWLREQRYPPWRYEE